MTKGNLTSMKSTSASNLAADVVKCLIVSDESKLKTDFPKLLTENNKFEIQSTILQFILFY